MSLNLVYVYIEADEFDLDSNYLDTLKKQYTLDGSLSDISCLPGDRRPIY